MPGDVTKRWVLKVADDGIVARQSEQLKVSLLLARLLVLRCLADLDSAKRYLSSSLRSDLPSPCTMADMEPAVERIIHAIKNQELIGVWGDYDVDGTTGASVLVSFLREIGAEPVYHVPHRVDEGYGLNTEGLKRLRERGVGLVVTVDCGISNAREIDAARDFGRDVVVPDHRYGGATGGPSNPAPGGPFRIVRLRSSRACGAPRCGRPWRGRRRWGAGRGCGWSGPQRRGGGRLRDEGTRIIDHKFQRGRL